MNPSPSFRVFIAGATGYMGSRLAARLIARGHSVAGLVRPGSENRLPAGCAPVRGNALDHTTFAQQLSGFHTYVQLVGVAHPSPAKAKEFEAIDRVSCEQSLLAVKDHAVRHFVYVSVAHPAPMMKAYIAVRTYCEEQIRAAGLNATILRPWYVLGPGHYWPYLLIPGYWVARQIPSMREGANPAWPCHAGTDADGSCVFGGNTSHRYPRDECAGHQERKTNLTRT